jgi:colicin import membrane protein
VRTRVKSVFTGKDAGEEIARINEEVAREDEAINARRDEAVRGREQERQRRRNEIEREREGVEGELNRMQEQERKEREARKQADLKEGEDAIAEARKEWEEALAEAKRKREEAEANRGPDRLKRPDFPELDDMAEGAKKKVDIQGTFNALAVRGLGGESLAERTAKAAEQIAGGVKKLVQEAQNGGLVFA